MTRRADLEEQRDQRLLDLVELDRRIEAGELSDDEAARLRRHDEAAALAALDALDALDERHRPSAPDDPEPQVHRSRRRRRLLASAAVGVPLIAVVVASLVGATSDRPPGGFVTGNELSVSGETPDTRDDVPLDALEAVVADNPDVVGMRLALADRLFTDGQYPEAASHYLEVVQRTPEPRALTRLAWLTAMDGRLDAAATLADTALEQLPNDPEAIWVRADIASAAGDRDHAQTLFERLLEDPSLGDDERSQIQVRLEQLTAGQGEDP